MGKRIDLTGQRFGRLVVLKQAGREKGGAILWCCQCDCGAEKNVSSSNLLGGRTTSCGCFRRERVTENNLTHGQRHTRLWGIWHGMKARCYIPSSTDYDYYGGRGITVCDEWREDFTVFRDWAMSHGYNDSLSIDRIDNDKGYFPDNCRWTTAKEQANNRRPRKKKT